MKYQPPDEFNAIAYPEFSCLDTMFFADIGRSENDFTTNLCTGVRDTAAPVPIRTANRQAQWNRLLPVKPV